MLTPRRDTNTPGDAGYSGTPLPKKLGIKPNSVVAAVGAPLDVAETLKGLPDGAVLRTAGSGRRDLTLCFVRSEAELARRASSIARWAGQGMVWILWPTKFAAAAGSSSRRTSSARPASMWGWSIPKCARSTPPGRVSRSRDAGPGS